MSRGGQKLTIEQIWPQLERGCNHLLTRLNEGFSMKDHMKLYSSVYDYCTTAKPVNARDGKQRVGANFAGEELYRRLQDFLVEHVNSILTGGETRMDDSLLNYYKKEWDRYTTALKVVNHIFQYLNRHWIKRESEDGNKDIYEIYTLGLVVWKTHIFSNSKSRLTKALLSLIEKERDNEQIDVSLVQGIIGTFVSVGVEKDKDEPSLDIYRRDFEEEFLLATEIYYTNESTYFIANNSVCEYMKKVEQRLDQERHRLSTYLHHSTGDFLLNKCYRVMIDKHKDTVWLEFQQLLDDDKIEDLARMYNLLSLISNALDPLIDVLEKHILVVGANAITQVTDSAFEDPRVYVETILKVHKKYQDLVTNAFQSNPGFGAALDKACRRFINDNSVTQKAKSSSKSPELVAKFCDVLLKKSAKNPEEQQVLDILNDIMLVFKYIEDKDVFQTYYSKMLAKRLIHGTSVSDYLEGQMIAKLKQNCGYEYTSKLARMFSDMSVSREIQDKFKESRYASDVDFDLQILVLATGSWPLQPPSTNFAIPKELQSCERAFQNFYQSQHSGRKINWLMQFSKGELKTKYTSKTFLFQCSTYQMGVLLLFNDVDILTGEQIQEASQLNDAALKATLMSLITTKILLMAPKDVPSITKKHKFTLNAGYKNKRQRVLINIPVNEPKENGPEGGKSDTQRIIEEDRKLQIQASVVRIMKARKTLNHGQLMSEVLQQLQNRFKPKIPMIKKCIDILIEKEYLQRIEGQKDMYSYVA